MKERGRITIQTDIAALLRLLPDIQALADSEREPLGFLPAAAFEEAIGRKRLFAATATEGKNEELAGYLLHGGVFPHAKVQQIAVSPRFRKMGVASTLMRTLISDLEHAGFMTIKAEVASDLSSALAFYTANGFEFVRQRAGGQARNRTILVHVRQLETDSLFSAATDKASTGLDLGIKRRSVGETPFFAFDLNVYFDLVKDRAQSDNARRLFGAALRHDIRLAVADEFVAELRRASIGASADPILQMALQLPRLPKVDLAELDKMATSIHDLVFVRRQARGVGSKQAVSDARHLAHAALSRASAFVTRDGSILSARTELLSTVGIDVAEPDELIALLPSELYSEGPVPLQGKGFASISITSAELSAYLNNERVPASLISEFCVEINPSLVRREAISENGQIVAVGALGVSKGIEPLARLLVHVRPEHTDCDMFADYMLDTLIKSAWRDNAISLELSHLPGQSSVNSLARARGFFRAGNSASYSKIAIGRPLTADNWQEVAQAIRRRTGLALPDRPPQGHDMQNEIGLTTPAGQLARIGAGKLEDLLSPTIFVWPGRHGLIVPINRAYADELLGSSQQPTFAFIANRDAAFLSRRAYVNSPRAAKQMRPDSPILFYESKRQGRGRGAVVAVGRIVDSMVVGKSEIPTDGYKLTLPPGFIQF